MKRLSALGRTSRDQPLKVPRRPRKAALCSWLRGGSLRNSNASPA